MAQFSGVHPRSGTCDDAAMRTRWGALLAVGLGGCLGVPEPEISLVDDDGCVPASAYAPVADDFSNDGAPSWGEIGVTTSGSSTIESDGMQLVARPSGIEGDYAWIQSAPLDFRTGRLVVRLVALPAQVRSCESWVAIVFGPDGDRQSRGFHVEDGRIVTGGIDVPYDADEHRWLQLRADGTDLHTEVSADAVTWYRLRLEALPAGLDAAAFEVGVGTFQAEPEQTGALAIDDLNLPPTRCP